MPTQNITNKIEILSINDKDPNDSNTDVQLTPNERMVVNEVIQIWKHDPATESLGIAKLHVLVKESQPQWMLSEKRLKTLLKKYGLLANQPKFTYANEITSKPTPNLELPAKIKLQSAKTRGKGLYATTQIPKGTLLWEEKPFIFIPPLDHAYLMKIGKACSYCGKLLSSRLFDSTSFLQGLDCKYCDELWCSKQCKRQDTLHMVLNHNEHSKKANTENIKINSKNWTAYKEFCLENHWNAAYAVAIIRIHELIDSTGQVANQFDAFAKIRQDIRYKAHDSSAGAFDNSNGGDGALFVKEQQELLWHKGHEMFVAIFNDDEHKLNYEEYLTYIGTYNINNIDSLYLIQSHLNHNCDKNVDVQVESSTKRLCDGIKVFASRDLKANEELVTSYVNPNHNVHQRKRELRVNWGFNCNCNRCKKEEKEAQRLQSNEGAAAHTVPVSTTTNDQNKNEKKSDDKKESNGKATPENENRAKANASTNTNNKSSTKSSRKNSRKSSEHSLTSRSAIKAMLEKTAPNGDDGDEFELIGAEQHSGRRKSVRFDEKVVAVNE